LLHKKTALVVKALQAVKTSFEEMTATGVVGIVGDLLATAMGETVDPMPMPEKMVALGLGSFDPQNHETSSPLYRFVGGPMAKHSAPQIAASVLMARELQVQRITHGSRDNIIHRQISGGHAIAYDPIYTIVDMVVLGTCGFQAFLYEDHDFKVQDRFRGDAMPHLRRRKDELFPPFMQTTLLYLPGGSVYSIYRMLMAARLQVPAA
jgi:hypothetical protein